MINIFISIISVFWCLFQISIATWLATLQNLYKVIIHLAFALSLTFILAIKKSKNKNLKIVFLILLIISVLSCLYPIIDLEKTSFRAGNPLPIDIILGSLLIISLLIACKKAIGLPIVIVSLVFIYYCFFSEYMPNFLAAKAISLSRFIGQTYMTGEGIFGIPLSVSTNTVFLFVFFGCILDRIGAGTYFINLALSLVGRYRGGPAKASVLGSGLTGMVSGSSIANIVTTGTFTIPLMKNVGYPAEKAAAIEVAASTDGQLAPPIMGAAAFIMAATLDISYFQVIKAAVLPALVSYCSLFYITHLEATKLGLKVLKKEDTPKFLDTLKQGIHFIIPIIYLLYNLLQGYSPENSIIKAIFLMIAIMVIKEILDSKDKKVQPIIQNIFTNLYYSCINACKNMVKVALATATAGIIVGVIALGLGGQINAIIEFLSMGNIFLIIIIAAIASLIVGMGLPTTATYIVMASLTAPVIVNLGQEQGIIIPLLAAHLFCFYFGILADDTPPVGLAAYTASAIAESKPIPTGIQAFSYDVRTAILPFMFIFNHDLILHNITNIWHILFICITALFGGFAFVNFTQNFFLTKNNKLESFALVVISITLFQPKIFFFIIQNKYIIQIFAIALYLFIYFNQKIRMNQKKNL